MQQSSTVGLCSMSDETIGEAERVLPRNLCPLIKSSYGFAATDKMSVFYFSDLIIGETTCDGKKKMYEYLEKIETGFFMELPNSQSESGMKLWKEEMFRLKHVLEEKLDVTITEEKLREAVHIKNEERSALKELSYLMTADPAPMLGQDMFKVLYGASYKFDKRESIREIQAVTAQIKRNTMKERCRKASAYPGDRIANGWCC